MEHGTHKQHSFWCTVSVISSTLGTAAFEPVLVRISYSKQLLLLIYTASYRLKHFLRSLLVVDPQNVSFSSQLWSLSHDL